MKFISTSNNGSFEIQDQGTKIAALRFLNSFSSKAEAQLPEHSLNIRANNFFHTSFVVLRQESQIGSLCLNWKGHVVIRIMGKSGNEHSFTLKQRGFWDYRFELLNEIMEIELVLRPKSKFPKFRPDYELEFRGPEMTDIDTHELLLFTGYGITMLRRLGFLAVT